MNTPTEGPAQIAWMRPLFRWAGSKRQMLPKLMSAMPRSYETYIEPFAGSACLFFAVRPHKAILGDFNAELIHAYKMIRLHPRRVARTSRAWATDSPTFYSVRSMSPESLDPVERAARFTYLNRFAFNGVYRTNQRGEFNVPRGTRTGALPKEAEFYRSSVALRDADLGASDFEVTLARASEEDFVYVDPPYSTSRPTHGEYGYGSFSSTDEDRLYAALDRLDRVGAHFMLSYGGDAPVAVAERWRTTNLSAVRTVGGSVGSRHVTPEYLVSNYDVQGLAQ